MCETMVGSFINSTNSSSDTTSGATGRNKTPFRSIYAHNYLESSFSNIVIFL